MSAWARRFRAFAHPTLAEQDSILPPSEVARRVRALEGPRRSAWRGVEGVIGETKMVYEPTPLQRYFQDNTTLSPPDYRFSRDNLKRNCPYFVDTDAFYKTASLFIGLFEDLRAQLSELKLLDHDAVSLAKACIGLTNLDTIVAFQTQTQMSRQEQKLASSPRDFISVLANRSVTTASGAKLNLDESFPSLADTLQTILDVLPHLARELIRKGFESETENGTDDELRQFGLLSNAYRIAKGDWENALWLNFRLKDDEDVLGLHPVPQTPS
jgi:hypothetical protein